MAVLGRRPLEQSVASLASIRPALEVHDRGDSLHPPSGALAPALALSSRPPYRMNLSPGRLALTPLPAFCTIIAYILRCDAIASSRPSPGRTLRTGLRTPPVMPSARFFRSNGVGSPPSSAPHAKPSAAQSPYRPDSSTEPNRPAGASISLGTSTTKTLCGRDAHVYARVCQRSRPSVGLLTLRLLPIAIVDAAPLKAPGHAIPS